MKKLLYWSPRILSLIYVGFISLFALDVFNEGYFGWEIIIGLLIHLIPTFILIAIIIVAWKNDLIGAALFIGLAILFTKFFNTYREPISFIIISGSLFLIGILFFINFKKTNQPGKL